MSEKEYEATLREVIAEYGEDHQLLKAVEESAELTIALMHYRDGKMSKEEVLTEMADVFITMNQVMLVLDISTLELFAEVDAKMQRLRRHLSDREASKRRGMTPPVVIQ